MVEVTINFDIIPRALLLAGFSFHGYPWAVGFVTLSENPGFKELPREAILKEKGWFSSFVRGGFFSCFPFRSSN